MPLAANTDKCLPLPRQGLRRAFVVLSLGAVVRQLCGYAAPRSVLAR